MKTQEQIEAMEAILKDLQYKRMTAEIDHRFTRALVMEKNNEQNAAINQKAYATKHTLNRQIKYAQELLAELRDGKDPFEMSSVQPTSSDGNKSEKKGSKGGNNVQGV